MSDQQLIEKSGIYLSNTAATLERLLIQLAKSARKAIAATTEEGREQALSDLREWEDGIRNALKL